MKDGAERTPSCRCCDLLRGYQHHRCWGSPAPSHCTATQFPQPLGAHRFAALMMDSTLSFFLRDEPVGSLFLGFPSPPPSSQHVRLPSMGQLEPHHPHRAWDGSGASDVSNTGGGHPSRLSAPAVLPLPPQPRARPPSSLCYYHHRFGPAARNCQPPCSWKRTSRPATRGQLPFTWFQLIVPGLRLHATQRDNLSVLFNSSLVPSPRLLFRPVVSMLDF